MVLDIIIVLILLSTAIYGFRKGFVYTLIHAVGWVGAIVLAYFATPFTSSFLKENTGLYNWVHGLLNTRFDASLDTVEASMKSLPEVISQSVNNFSTNIVDGVTGTFTNIVYTVLVFVLLFFLFKVILWLILRLFSKDYH
ncbi:MAG: CvpA family protein, partial [Anaerovoracaceae bacterium]